ncbi:MAG: MotA/TolQ/ExbB proton channel family protein [Desulfomonilia bacterium]
MIWLERSGIVGYILLGISIITLALFLERIIMLLIEQARYRNRAGIYHMIVQITEQSRTLDKSSIEERITIMAEKEIDRLSSGIGFIRLVSQTSPLLGLLGTVFGMITAFRRVSNAGGSVNPAELASGIWVALLTTAEGLIVALAAFLMYHYLQFIINKMAKSVTYDSHRILEGLSHGSDQYTA